MTDQKEKERPFPTIPTALVAELNNRWPERCADLEWDEKSIWYFAGQRSVVRFLNAIHHDQNEVKL